MLFADATEGQPSGRVLGCAAAAAAAAPRPFLSHCPFVRLIKATAHLSYAHLSLGSRTGKVLRAWPRFRVLGLGFN